MIYRKKESLTQLCMRGTTFDGMEIHENFIPHDSLCATGESLHSYYPLGKGTRNMAKWLNFSNEATSTHDHVNRNNNQCTTQRK